LVQQELTQRAADDAKRAKQKRELQLFIAIVLTIGMGLFGWVRFRRRTVDAETLANTNLPVPPGTYSATRRTDHTPNRVELSGVTGAANVQIHNGNDINDVEGCFAAGKSRSADFVGDSVNAINDINAILNSDNGAITVIVVGGASGPPRVRIVVA
jgi:hypothetical protein